MPYKPRIVGDSFRVSTTGKAGVTTLAELKHGQWPDGYVDQLCILNNASSGGATILVGPNLTADYPLAPQVQLPLKNVRPGDVAVDDLGTSVQIGVVYGGQLAEDVE